MLQAAESRCSASTQPVTAAADQAVTLTFLLVCRLLLLAEGINAEAAV